jgi:hypothetical protein
MVCFLFFFFIPTQDGGIPLDLACRIEIHSEFGAIASELFARQPFGSNSNPRPPIGDHRSAGIWPNAITKSQGAKRHIFGERIVALYVEIVVKHDVMLSHED